MFWSGSDVAPSMIVPEMPPPVSSVKLMLPVVVPAVVATGVPVLAVQDGSQRMLLYSSLR